MPRSAQKPRRALVAQADAQVIPVPTALFERAVVEAMADLAGLVARIDAYRQAGGHQGRRWRCCVRSMRCGTGWADWRRVSGVAMGAMRTAFCYLL